jgi:hypothetical protein
MTVTCGTCGALWELDDSQEAQEEAGYPIEEENCANCGAELFPDGLPE